MNTPSRRFDGRIERARRDDREPIARCNEHMARETEGLRLDPARVRRGVAAILEDPALGFYLVARSGEEIAGCLMVTFEWSDWRNGLFWWIQSVYVEPPWRRQGVYSALYAELTEQAKAADAIGLRLYVERENAVAQATYRRLGMEECRYAMFEALLDAAPG